MARQSPRLALATLAAGALFVAILAALVVPYRRQLRNVIQAELKDRDADVLYPEALQQVAESEAAAGGPNANAAELLVPVLKTANLEDAVNPQAEGMIAVTIFDADGNAIQAVPSTQLLPEIAPEDYPRLIGGEKISRYYPDFPIDQYLAQVSGPADQRRIPVLEVVLPLHGSDPNKNLGFIQYYIDARKLADELAVIDGQLDRKTAVTLSIGAALVAIILATTYFGLSRARREIAERNARLTRANFELTLAAKASVLGQITSHLIHGLQGPVAGLRAAVAGSATPDWRSAADYADRLQAIIQETVAFLGDTSTHVVYPLTGRELADTIRRRNAAAAAEKGVGLVVDGEEEPGIDSQRGSLLCLIATNLVQNAIAATPAGHRVAVTLGRRDGASRLLVADEGGGIPEAVRPHLFEPGHSGRPGGTGLGLAISQLLARQIGATLTLESTGPAGTVFGLVLPVL
jgi:signal transduction histidine kinase